MADKLFRLLAFYSILVSKNTISGGNKRHSLVQYITFPSRLHNKLKVAGRQVFRLKKFAVISNMHITITIYRK